jgi:hypothetical protein
MYTVIISTLIKLCKLIIKIIININIMGIKENFDDKQSLLFSGGSGSGSSDPDAGDDKHCFPYYDFIRDLYRRFDGSFITILLF